MMRTVLVHYHVFKNAGTTIDGILENTFGRGWRPFEGAGSASKLSENDLLSFLRKNEDVKAVSSHHLIFSVPQDGSLRIFPILFIRHPIDRVRSIYEFERKQGILNGPVSKGAEHAARLSFSDYLNWRLDGSVNGVVHNCQSAYVLGSSRYARHEMGRSDYDRAVEIMSRLPFVGIVERFDDSLLNLVKLLRGLSIHLVADYCAKNVNETREEDMLKRLDRTRLELGDAVWARLLDRNKWDMALYEWALSRVSIG